MKFDMDQLRKALGKIKITKAPGQDGWRPAFWKIIVQSIYEERVMKKLLKLINLCMKGFYGQMIGRQIAVTRGIPIAKDKSKRTVRPIAIGLSLRRIITSMITENINPRINEIVEEVNLSTTKKNGIPIFADMMNCMVRKKYYERICSISY